MPKVSALFFQKQNLRVPEEHRSYGKPTGESMCSAKQTHEALPTMAITTPKELFFMLLSDLRHGAERTAKIYEELAQATQDPAIKEALDAREFISSQILSRLDECFRLLGQKPMKASGRLYDVFIEDFRRELLEVQVPLARRIFILEKACRLMHLRVGEYVALMAAETTGHPAIGVLLESCLADKLAFAERMRRLIREQLEQKLVAA